MRELYGIRGLGFAFKIMMALAMLCFLSLCAVLAQMFKIASILNIGIFCALYLCAFGTVGLLLRALSGELFRLGLTPWLPIFKHIVTPLLCLGAICAIIAHLFSFYKTTLLGQAILLVPILLGAILWLELSRRLWGFLKETRSAYEMCLKRCSSYSTSDDLRRVRESCEMVLGMNLSVPTSNQREFVLRGLSEKPWYERNEFPWISPIENQFALIREEVLGVITSKKLDSYDYPGAVQGKWDSLMLVESGRILLENCTLVPRLFELMKKLPHFPLFREAQISVLRPGSQIIEHRDSTNLYITGHLAIQVPEESGISVAGEMRSWKEGEFLFFSTVYEHTAWNDSNIDRIVFIVDFLHPEITDSEARFFRGGLL